GLVPAALLTRTSTVPAACAGAVAVTCPSETGIAAVAGTPPKLASVTSARCVPEIATDVPPAAGPEEGETAVMLGAPTRSALTSSSSPGSWLLGDVVLPSASPPRKYANTDPPSPLTVNGDGAPTGQSSATMSPACTGSGLGSGMTFTPLSGATCGGPVP